ARIGATGQRLRSSAWPSRPSGGASGRIRPEIAPEPLEDVPKALEPVARLARARHLVVLAREADEADLAAELLERDEELLAVFDRAAQILLGANDQQRRHDVLRVRERRALAVARPGLPRPGAAQLRHVEAMADVAGAEHRVLAVHRALRARRLEAPRVADGPAREKSAVAAAEHAETIRIEERIARERLVERRHYVGIVAAAPVADHRLGEGLAVSLAASRVRVDDGVAGAGVHLELVEEVVPVHRVRAAVDVEQSRIAPAVDESGGPHHPHVQLEAGAGEAESLGRRKGHRLGPRAVQLGQPALGAAVGAAREDFGWRHRATRR